jgi:hypothetical protein
MSCAAACGEWRVASGEWRVASGADGPICPPRTRQLGQMQTRVARVQMRPPHLPSGAPCVAVRVAAEGRIGRIRTNSALTASRDLEWSHRRDLRRRAEPADSDSRYGHLHMTRLGRVPRGGEAGPERTLEIPEVPAIRLRANPEVAERAQVGGHPRPADLSREAGRRLGTGRSRHRPATPPAVPSRRPGPRPLAEEPSRR